MNTTIKSGHIAILLCKMYQTIGYNKIFQSYNMKHVHAFAQYYRRHIDCCKKAAYNHVNEEQ